MERKRRRLLYAAGVVAAAPFIPGIVPRLAQGQQRASGEGREPATRDQVLDEILQLQTHGLAMTSNGHPTAEGLRTQAAAIRMMAAYAPSIGLDREVRELAERERARQWRGEAPRRYDESSIRTLLRQRGVDDGPLVIGVPDQAREEHALTRLTEGDFVALLRAIASALDRSAILVERRGGLVRHIQENEPFQQSPEAVCADLAYAQSAAAVGMALSCPFPTNPACAFFSGVFAGVTASMWYYGCY